MDASLLPLRDYGDLSRAELMTRLRHFETLRIRVAHTHNNYSPRQLRAFGMAVLALVISYALTYSLILSGISCLVAIIGVLQYSRLPMTWREQLLEGISSVEVLRRSPLRQMAGVPDAASDWSYALYCLSAEISLTRAALAQPARPFSA